MLLPTTTAALRHRSRGPSRAALCGRAVRLPQLRLLCVAPTAGPRSEVEHKPEPIVGPAGPYGLLHRFPRVAPYIELARMEKPIGVQLPAREWFRGSLVAFLESHANTSVVPGSMLLYWPGAWSICLAAEPGALPDPYLLGAFGVGKQKVFDSS